MIVTSVAYATGTVTGTGTPLNVTGDKAGVQARSIRLLNRTKNCVVHWNAEMLDGSAIKVTTAAAYIATGGITPIAGGFTIGDDADVNSAADIIYYEMWG